MRGRPFRVNGLAGPPVRVGRAESRPYRLKGLNGEAKPELAFETAVAQEMRIDGAIEGREAQPWGKIVCHLLPDFGGIGGGVGYSVFHGRVLRRRKSGSKLPQSKARAEVDAMA